VFFRLFVFVSSLFFNLYACQQGAYSSCVAKVKDSHTFVDKTLFIPLEKKRRLVYSLHTPNGKIIKYDPFLSLYLLTDTKPFAYPFEINKKSETATAMVTQKSSCSGKILREQIGLNQLASYSEPIIAPSLLTNSCCFLEGIVTSRGIIQKAYLQHFLKSKDTRYGDIGVRLHEERGVVSVIATDPFIEKNPFKKGDRFLSYDGKKLKSAAAFMQRILFSSVGSKHRVVIQREKKQIVEDVIVHKRYGGGMLSDTFLESKGAFFDKKLRLLHVKGEFKKLGLRAGDKLLQVNGRLVQGQKELRKYIENFNDYASLLFERNGFEFFVKIK